MCDCCCALEFDRLSRAAQVLSLCPLCLRAQVSELRFCAVALLLHRPPSGYRGHEPVCLPAILWQLWEAWMEQE